MVARHWLWMMPAGAVAAAGIWALRTFDPNQPGNPFLGCAFLQLTGWYCPGCGMTRTLHALVHFDLVRALDMNAFFVVAAPIGGLLVLRGLDRLPKWSEPWLRPFANGWLWAGSVLAFGVLRNLSWPPFAWLAPG